MNNGLKRAWRAAARAFTVVEMLLVVGIMALLTIGIAKVFSVTGETVKAGKRSSNLNAYAAMIEKQLRSDFASMTRDGFLMIRHRTAGSTAPYYADDLISLAPGDPSPRVRRVDELVGFAAGDFVSKRDPVYPGRQARSTQARIYLGHGLSRDPAAPGYFDPVNADDLNDTTATPGFGVAGPARYASGWMLLRHETLLCQPKSMVEQLLPTTLVDPNPVYTGGDPASAVCEDMDGDIQIELQLAASGVFRILLPYEPDAASSRFGNNYVVRDETTAGLPQRPFFASGIVDIATTDLAEIRAVILDSQGVLYSTRFNQFADLDPADPLLTPITGVSFGADLAPGAVNSVTRRMHAWMRSVLPANSDAGVRMRFEPQPPNFLGTSGGPLGPGSTKEYQRTDQMMLAASNFVPGCSEFIVEWSFGKTYPTTDPQGRGGQVIWHGLSRPGGVTPTGQVAYAALPYGDMQNNGADWYRMPYARRDGSTGYWPPLEITTAPMNISVIRDYAGPLGSSTSPEYSYFGYIDPTYRLRSAYTDLNNNGLADPGEFFQDKNGNGVQDAATEPTLSTNIWYDPTNPVAVPDPREPESIPWPWPKMVRITMSLADPVEPLREQTFQFIFDVPPAPGTAQ